MSIFGSSALSDPNADTIVGIQIKRLPPGAALGAGDLHEWAQRRNAGRASVFVSKEERARRAKRGEDRADHWLRGAARRKRRR